LRTVAGIRDFIFTKPPEVQLGKEAHGEKLRNEILQIVRGRLDEIKGTQTKS